MSEPFATEVHAVVVAGAYTSATAMQRTLTSLGSHTLPVEQTIVIAQERLHPVVENLFPTFPDVVYHPATTKPEAAGIYGTVLSHLQGAVVLRVDAGSIVHNERTARALAEVEYRNRDVAVVGCAMYEFDGNKNFHSHLDIVTANLGVRTYPGIVKAGDYRSGISELTNPTTWTITSSGCSLVQDLLLTGVTPESIEQLDEALVAAALQGNYGVYNLRQPLTWCPVEKRFGGRPAEPGETVLEAATTPWWQRLFRR